MNWFSHQRGRFLFNVSLCHVLIYHRKERTSDEHICCTCQTNLGSISCYRTHRLSQDLSKCNRESVKMTSCQEQDFFFVQKRKKISFCHHHAMTLSQVRGEGEETLLLHELQPGHKYTSYSSNKNSGQKSTLKIFRVSLCVCVCVCICRSRN